MMTPRTFATAAIAAFSAGLALHAGAAKAAGQVSIQLLGLTTVTVDECTDGCQVDLLFKVRNNGLVNSVISLRTMTESITGVEGTDILDDVVTAGPTGQAFPGSCGTALEAFQTCLIDAKVTVVDADPFDADHDDGHGDYGGWLVRLVVPWDVPQPPCDPTRPPTPDVCSDTTTSDFYDVRVYDDLADAVPEPAGWTLMLLGFGGLGAMLRRRRVALGA